LKNLTIWINSISLCDEQGGREPWGNGASCTGLESLTENLRKHKRGATTVKDERGLGLDFMICFIMFVWPADVREGLPALLSFCICLFYILKLCWMFAGSRLLLPVSTNCVTPCILKCNLNIQLYVHICIESGMKIILALIVTAFTTFATTKRHHGITNSRPFYLLTMQKWFHYAMSEAVGRILWRWLRAFSAGTSCF